MLSVDEGPAVGGFALLEGQRVLTIRYGCWLEAEHGAKGALAGSDPCAIGMNQFVEKKVSPPRGLVCWMSATNAIAHMSIQSSCMVIIMGHWS